MRTGFPWIVAALREATAPCLLVGGTADKLWDGEAARELSPHILEVEQADHSMNVPGPVVDSIAVLGRVVQAIEEFLETIAWPTESVAGGRLRPRPLESR